MESRHFREKVIKQRLKKKTDDCTEKMRFSDKRGID